MLTLVKYSVGIGDRFGCQAKAQLRACQRAAECGVEVIPVWNKSNWEHSITGSEPAAVRAAADAAVKTLGWMRPYHVDADHIRLDTVDRFLAHCDFFTLDVADCIGQPVAPDSVAAFTAKHAELIGELALPGSEDALCIPRSSLELIGRKYLRAVQAAGAIYRKIASVKGEGNFITEVSLDETDVPLSPPELLLVLAALADEGVPVQTIAPRFVGRFHKGVDYVGDLQKFEKEFRDDLAVIAYAVKRFPLPPNLKLSIHCGSDKFSLYPIMARAIREADAGLHLKTAGTSWLEEVIGLAESGGDGLALAKEIYARAVANRHELCAAWAAATDIDAARLPPPEVVNGWTSEQFVAALRHDPNNPAFNPSMRQLVHVGFRVAAQMGDRYLGMLRACEEVVARNVTTNLFERHLRPLFLS